MVASITFNPNLTTASSGLFNTSSIGLVQGVAHPDPAIRYKLVGGVLLAAETLPMWGGVGIFTQVPGVTPGPAISLGTPVGRATALTGSKALLGFSVFDQAYGMTNTPQSPVPLAASSMQVMYYRLGSGARIAVACDAALVSLEGGLTNAQVSWDFVAQKLVSYAPAYANVTITGAVWASTSGGQTTFTVGTDLSAVLVAGNTISVSGVVSTGGTGVGFNGDFVVAATPGSTTVVVTQVAASSPGTYSSGGTIAGGGGALPCSILQIQTTGNQTVSFDPVTGFATWNYNAPAALILI